MVSLKDWQERIQTLCPVFKSVRLLANAQKIENLPNAQFPCAFIVPLASKSEANKLANSHKQLVTKSIGIWSAALEAGDIAAGAIAVEQLEAIEEQLKDALSGWIPNVQCQPVNHLFSAVVIDDNKKMPFTLWQHVFSVTYMRTSK